MEIPKATKAGNFTVRGVICNIACSVSNWAMKVTHILC